MVSAKLNCIWPRCLRGRHWLLMLPASSRSCLVQSLLCRKTVPAPSLRITFLGKADGDRITAASAIVSEPLLPVKADAQADIAPSLDDDCSCIEARKGMVSPRKPGYCSDQQSQLNWQLCAHCAQRNSELLIWGNDIPCRLVLLFARHMSSCP